MQWEANEEFWTEFRLIEITWPVSLFSKQALKYTEPQLSVDISFESMSGENVGFEKVVID